MMGETPYVLAVDVGTSSLKAVLYGANGAVLDSATRRYSYRAEQPGWAESDPEDWWQAFEGALVDLKSRGAALSSLGGIAFTGQMHTGVLLDASGAVIQPTILWLDRRATAETVELTDALKLPPWQINSTYTLPKLAWLHRHRPEAIERTRTLLWPKDYLRYRLTGEVCTDPTEPGGAALLDWTTRTWALERLGWAGLDPAALPPIRKSSEIAGYPRRDIAERLGLPIGVPVLVGIGDVAALITGAPPAPGRVVCSFGSSSMIFAALADDQHPQDPTCRLYTYPLDPFRLFGGVSSTTGAALVWAYDSFAKGTTGLSFEETMTEAARSPEGAGGLCFIPYLAGERSPYWSDDIRGGFYGLQLAHERSQLVRAVMEGVAFSLRHMLDLYEEMGVPVRELAVAGGGAKTPGICRVIADACQKDVMVYGEDETVTRALYALCRAALDRGDFVASLLATFPEPEVIPCRPERGEAYRPGYEIYRRFASFAASEAAQARSHILKERA